MLSVRLCYVNYNIKVMICIYSVVIIILVPTTVCTWTSQELRHTFATNQKSYFDRFITKCTVVSTQLNATEVSTRYATRYLYSSTYN